MDALDTFAQILDSPLFMAAAVLTAAVAGGHALLRGLRTRQRIVAFMQTHGFRWTETGSTMWLARVIERWEVLEICGHFDGRWVDVRWHGRRGRSVTVTANRDLVTGQGARVISLGGWTRPKPPALLEGMHLSVSGQKLQVFAGTGDFTPYIVATVAYARILEEQPVAVDANPTAG